MSDSHRWALDDEGRATHGGQVVCAGCGLELVGVVEMVGARPLAALYVAGTATPYDPRTRGRCPAQRDDDR